MEYYITMKIKITVMCTNMSEKPIIQKHAYWKIVYLCKVKKGKTNLWCLLLAWWLSLGRSMGVGAGWGHKGMFKIIFSFLDLFILLYFMELDNYDVCLNDILPNTWLQLLLHLQFPWANRCRNTVLIFELFSSCFSYLRFIAKSSTWSTSLFSFRAPNPSFSIRCDSSLNTHWSIYGFQKGILK